MKAALPIAALASVAAVALVPAPALAQGAQQEKVRRLVVYGRDPCPRAQSGEEIVVCARRPETERYRIPRELRDSATQDDPDSASWAARAESLEYVGRTGIQSCSTVGPGGVSGCWNEMVRAWRRDRRQGDGEPGR
ncbi:MAG TPA: hypothetical protein VFQ67_11165 [Allosphingosinicella sp.]|jgi:hypothetical protein|nr:hypothetical protein [Allosphingosinicella sp.]